MSYADDMAQAMANKRPVFFSADGKTLSHCLNCRSNFVRQRDFRAHLVEGDEYCLRLDYRDLPEGWSRVFYGQNGFGVYGLRMESEQ